MALIPPRETTITKIYEGYVQRQRESAPRLHLGASEIGKECERQIWYSYRWVKETEFPGQILRLFDTGKLEENRLVADLNSIGIDVRAFDLKTGRQFRMELFGGHFGGSLDGLCLGLVEAPKTWHVLEMKTHNDKSFTSLVKSGVKASKPEHWAQMQIYMGMSHEVGLPEMKPINRAFYFAVNKNTDQLYTERLEYDGAAYIELKEKARRVIFSPTPLVKISNKADYYQCKWCNYNNICHAPKSFPFEKANRNCRTCLYSTPLKEGGWRCEKWEKDLCIEEQKAGCEKHLYIPKLVPLTQVDATDDSVIYEDDSGKVVINYEGGDFGTK